MNKLKPFSDNERKLVTENRTMKIEALYASGKIEHLLKVKLLADFATAAKTTIESEERFDLVMSYLNLIRRRKQSRKVGLKERLSVKEIAKNSDEPNALQIEMQKRRDAAKRS